MRGQEGLAEGLLSLVLNSYKVNNQYVHTPVALTLLCIAQCLGVASGAVAAPLLVFPQEWPSLPPTVAIHSPVENISLKSMMTQTLFNLQNLS